MSDPENNISQFFIQVDGEDLPVAVMDHLDEVVIEDDLAQPAMFVLRFHDPQLTLMDGDQFRLGREVIVGAANLRGRRKAILTAEITALEPELEQNNPVLVVRGYDRSHRLHRGRKTRTFLNQTDSEIAAQIAREVGLRTDIESTSERHVYVIQDNQTDMQFLQARAGRIGYRVQVEGQKLKFRQAEGSPPNAPAQDWGSTLLSFRARMTAVAQPNEVQVRGWDPKTKRAVVGKASRVTPTSDIGDGRSGGEAAQQSFGSAATVYITDQPVRTQGEADILAQSILDERAGDYLSAEGLCLGEPEIKAGTMVELTSVGRRFAGKYFVSASRHEFTPDGGYTTTFVVNGRRPVSLLAAFDGERPHSTVAGVVIGIVTNVNDPDGLGRVKVKFPWLDESHESDWARLATPGAGKERGFFANPEVEDEVLVAFEHGDINRPYIVGGLWNGKDKPPATAVQNGKVHMRTFKTRAGHAIELQDDDSSGKGCIRLKTSGGHLVQISDSEKGIQIKSQSHTITLDDQGRAVKLESGGDLELKGMGGKLSITTQGVELSSNASLKVQANALLDVKTNAVLTIQGSLVKIN